MDLSALFLELYDIETHIYRLYRRETSMDKKLIKKLLTMQKRWTEKNLEIDKILKIPLRKSMNKRRNWKKIMKYSQPVIKIRPIIKLDRKNIVFSNPLNFIEHKNVFIFDTETSGLPITNKKYIFQGAKNYYPYDDCSKYDKSRILQIGWAYIKNLEWSKISDVEVTEYLRKPSDFTEIDPYSEKIHGISLKKAMTGILFEDILSAGLEEILLECDYIIAHNAYFDVMILLNELFRIKRINLVNKILQMRYQKKIICTGEIGKCLFATGIRYPRLIDLYYSITGNIPEGAHQASNDVSFILKILPQMRDMTSESEREKPQNA